MGRLFINNVNEAQVRVVVQDELALNPPGSQLPTYASPPSGFSNGQMYRNTTDGKVYTMTPAGFKEVDLTVDSYSKILGSGFTYTILASEHKLESISGVKFYDTLGREVISSDYSVNAGLTVTINSELNLNSYTIKIFS